MTAIMEKICEMNGQVFYRITVKLANGTTKVEKFARLFDAQKRIRQIEEENKKGVIGNHYD
jgi:hypothetical protein